MHVCASNRAESVENGKFRLEFLQTPRRIARNVKGRRGEGEDAESQQRCEWQAQKQVRNFGESEEGATLVSARYVTRLVANY